VSSVTASRADGATTLGMVPTILPRPQVLDVLERRLFGADTLGVPTAVVALYVEVVVPVAPVSGMIADRLHGIVRPTDHVGQLDVGQFVVICDGPITPDGIDRLCQRIRAAFDEPFDVGDTAVVFHPVVGAAVSTRWTTSAAALLARAMHPTARFVDRPALADSSLPQEVIDRLVQLDLFVQGGGTGQSAQDSARRALGEVSELLGLLWASSMSDGPAARAVTDRIGGAARHVRLAQAILDPEVLA